MTTTPPRIDRVLAIDPGKVTGVAWMRQQDGEIFLDSSLEADADELINFLRPTLKEWKPVADGQPPLKVVIEKFTINSQTSQKSQEASWALRMIGAVEQACRDVEYPLGAISWQMPGEAKTAFTNEKLKRIGLWHRGGAGHALDAIRHGSLYLAKVGWVAKKGEQKV